jgi:hypothetical protein
MFNTTVHQPVKKLTATPPSRTPSSNIEPMDKYVIGIFVPLLLLVAVSTSDLHDIIFGRPLC